MECLPSSWRRWCWWEDLLLTWGHGGEACCWLGSCSAGRHTHTHTHALTSLSSFVSLNSKVYLPFTTFFSITDFCFQSKCLFNIHYMELPICSAFNFLLHNWLWANSHNECENKGPASRQELWKTCCEPKINLRERKINNIWGAEMRNC